MKIEDLLEDTFFYSFAHLIYEDGFPAAAENYTSGNKHRLVIIQAENANTNAEKCYWVGVFNLDSQKAVWEDNFDWPMVRTKIKSKSPNHIALVTIDAAFDYCFTVSYDEQGITKITLNMLDGSDVDIVYLTRTEEPTPYNHQTLSEKIKTYIKQLP